MTELEKAQAALARSRELRAEAESVGARVHRSMGSLKAELERNGFSPRIAKLFNLEGPPG